MNLNEQHFLPHAFALAQKPLQGAFCTDDTHELLIKHATGQGTREFKHRSLGPALEFVIPKDWGEPDSMHFSLGDLEFQIISTCHKIVGTFSNHLKI